MSVTLLFRDLHSSVNQTIISVFHHVNHLVNHQGELTLVNATLRFMSVLAVVP